MAEKRFPVKKALDEDGEELPQSGDESQFLRILSDQNILNNNGCTRPEVSWVSWVSVRSHRSQTRSHRSHGSQTRSHRSQII